MSKASHNTMLFVCYIVVTSENKMKSKKLSTDEDLLL